MDSNIPTLTTRDKMSHLQVIKRHGAREPYDPEKIHKPLFWCTQGLEHVSVSSIEMNLANRLIGLSEITSKQLHELLIESTQVLINTEYPDHDIATGRLINYQVRKEAYGDFNPPRLYEIIQRNVEANRYHKDLLSLYSEQEWDEINSFIDHTRDEKFGQAGAEQMRSKYLVKDRVTKRIYESFQIPYILVPAILYRNWDKEVRMAKIKAGYEALSTFDISLPTPIMAGLRTPKKQLASCVLIHPGDSLESIAEADKAALKYIANRAGLGINVGSNRGLGASINNGMAYHTGLVPFIKKFTSTVKSCSQGAVRDGAVTFFMPMWHMEFPELVVLKDNSLTENNSNISADYAFQINKFLLQRLIQGKDITLFSPGENETPGLYEAFFKKDQSEFARLYEHYEADPTVRKRVFPAVDLFNRLAIQRSSTGRIYVMFVDTVNQASSFKVPIKQSNLCMEIVLPTTELTDCDVGMPNEISTCLLAAVNMGKVNKPSDLEGPCRVAVELLDEIIDYQDYPVKAAEETTRKRRPLGIGIIGLAHFLAKRGLAYNEVSCAEADKYAEAYSYYCIKASVELAKKKGPCELYKETRYSDGWVPHDSAAPFVGTFCPLKERLDWSGLRQDLVQFGIRNSTLMAGMPSETSSQLSGETNGYQPARGPVIKKTSKDGVFTMVVPEYKELGNYYDYEWDQKTPEGYLKMVSVFQRRGDQAISVNTSYNPKHFPKGEITTKQIIGDMLLAYKLGHKTLYYQNTRKPGESDIDSMDKDDGCSDGACKI